MKTLQITGAKTEAVTLLSLLWLLLPSFAWWLAAICIQKGIICQWLHQRWLPARPDKSAVTRLPPTLDVSHL